MKSAGSLALATIMLALAAGAAHAVEFKSVGARPAILYDAPSERGRRVFIAPRGMPVEVILNYNGWTKVRDAGGDLSWIEANALTPKRNVVVVVANARIHESADEASPDVATADKGVLLELSGPAASGWIKVRHQDGASGYVKASDVWGE